MPMDEDTSKSWMISRCRNLILEFIKLLKSLVTGRQLIINIRKKVRKKKKINWPRNPWPSSEINFSFVTTRPIRYRLSNLARMKMASILNSQSRDPKHRGTFGNHSEVIILSMKSLARLKDQVKSLVFKISINEIDFHKLFDDILVLKVVFSFFSGLLHDKSAGFSGEECKL